MSESSHAIQQQLTIPMVTPDKTRQIAQVIRWSAGECHVQITCNGRSWQGSGDDALASLIDVRQRFEPDGYRLLCYGASLNGSASGMSRDADKVYQLEWRQPPERAKTKSIHDVFDTGPDVIPATYREQQIFKERWLTGVKLDRQSVPYDLLEYPVVAVDLQGHVTRCHLAQNLVMTDTISDVALKMVFIPSGTCLMGVANKQDGSATDRYHHDEPQHEVRIRKQFWLGQYPVTQAQWRTVAALPPVQFAMRSEPSQYKPHLDFDLENHPISGVSWQEAIEFCARLSAHTGRPYRLPTEAEWEYACKAETTTPFSFGNYFLLERSQLPSEFITAVTSPSAGINNQMYLLNCDGLMKGTTPVGSYPANPWGLYDMHGNVWEWCLDHWHPDYSTKPETCKQDGHTPWTKGNPPAERKYRMLRGGTCRSSMQECLSTSRHMGSVEMNPHSDVYGLRVLCSAR
ncbi:MAG: formylglycine-generating enzyme family protein [Cyanobacteria bacterium P01_F01_bin.86]